MALPRHTVGDIYNIILQRYIILTTAYPSLPTLGWAGGAAIFGIAAFLIIRRQWRKKDRKHNKRLARQRYLTYKSTGWHRDQCARVNTEVECNCAPDREAVTGDRPVSPAKSEGFFA